MQLSNRQAGWLLGSLSLITALFLFVSHLNPSLNLRFLGNSSTPLKTVNGRELTSGKCGFAEYRLAVRELGLITNIAIKPQLNDQSIWSTNMEGGSLSLWVTRETEAKALLNRDDSSVRIPIVEPTTLLLYGLRQCTTNDPFQKVEVLVNYSDNRTRSVAIFNQPEK